MEKQIIENYIYFNDSFKKIVIVRDNIKAKIDDNGIVTMSLKEFLHNKDSLDL